MCFIERGLYVSLSISDFSVNTSSQVQSTYI